MNYTETLKAELERVTLRGNPDKETIRRLAAIIFDMEQRIKSLEGAEDTAAEEPAPVVEEPKKETPKTNTRRVSKTTED